MWFWLNDNGVGWKTSRRHLVKMDNWLTLQSLDSKVVNIATTKTNNRKNLLKMMWCPFELPLHQGLVLLWKNNKWLLFQRLVCSLHQWFRIMASSWLEVIYFTFERSYSFYITLSWAEGHCVLMDVMHTKWETLTKTGQYQFPLRRNRPINL